MALSIFRTPRPLAIALSLLPILAAAAANAHDAPCPLPYMTFEYAVPHLDLDSCPAAFGEGAIFCRASVANDQLHVFAFEETGDQCLIRVVSYYEDDFTLAVE